VLERLLVIYDAAAARLEAGDRAALDAIRPAARIARDFVEGYHERIEEQYVFPRLERANRLVGLVAVLRAQHDAGRGLTDFIQGLALGALAADRDRASLAGALRGYASMFRPHVAREDSVLFPAFHEVAGASYRELGDEFEAVEQRRFGKNGFEHFVALLPAIETQVGVSDLAKFTVTAPQVEAHSAGRGPSRS
jgi:hemerythrin-like domain-containing protein